MQNLILSLERSAVKRWCAGDPLAWAEISAADILYIDPNLAKPIQGLAEFRDYLLGSAGKIQPILAELDDPRVVVVGDAAVLAYCLLETQSGRALWNVTEVYFRRGDEWKIVHSHWGYVGHHMPPRVETPIPLQLPPQPSTGLLGELMALETAAMERWRKGDPDGFIEISAPDVSYIDTGTRPRIDGLAGLRAEYDKRAGKIFFDIMDFVDPQVRACGDLAALVYRFFSGGLKPDGSITRNTAWYCTEVFVRRDGRWQILQTQWSFIQGVRNE